MEWRRRLQEKAWHVDPNSDVPTFMVQVTQSVSDMSMFKELSYSGGLRLFDEDLAQVMTSKTVGVQSWERVCDLATKGYYYRGSTDPGNYGYGYWLLAVFSEEQIEQLCSSLRSIKHEVWADAVGAAIGLLIMVEAFHHQLADIFPNPHRVWARVEASMQACHAHCQPQALDVMKKTKRLKVPWRGYDLAVVEVAETWLPHANVRRSLPWTDFLGRRTGPTPAASSAHATFAQHPNSAAAAPPSESHSHPSSAPRKRSMSDDEGSSVTEEVGFADIRLVTT
jgi:hypothetical protein